MKEKISFSQKDIPNLRKQMKNELILNRLQAQQIENFCSNFSRKTLNMDGESCWMNSCLQLILNALDHSEVHVEFFSTLGNQLRVSQTETMINPQVFKEIFQDAMENNSLYMVVENILSGQQDARHFFNIISDNVDAFPDVFHFLQHTTQQVITCLNCNYQSYGQEIQNLYYELPVPPHKSKLKNYLQSSINDGDLIEGYRCENNCHSSAIKKYALLPSKSSPFLIVALTISQDNSQNEIDFTEDITLISHSDTPLIYEFIGLVKFIGEVSAYGAFKGHYIANIKTLENTFYRTDDSRTPRLLAKSEVSKQGFIVLFKRKSR